MKNDNPQITYVKDGKTWLIKVARFDSEKPPKSGDLVDVSRKNGSTDRHALGELVDTNPDGSLIFTKGTIPESTVEFKNFAGLEKRSWYQFKKAVKKLNETADDKIVMAHAARTTDGLAGRLYFESKEKIWIELDKLL